MEIGKQKWYFNGVPLMTPAWAVEEVPDGYNTPPKRGSNIQVPYRTGNRWIAKKHGERHIVLNMWVRGVDYTDAQLPAGMENYEKLLLNVDYLQGVFGVLGQKDLQRKLIDGHTRTAKAEVQDVMTIPIKYPALFSRFSVDFLLADPYFYSSSKTTDIQSINGTSETWTHTNPGNAPAYKMVIVLNGPMTNPKLTNNTNGVWVQFAGSILAGDSVTLDVDKYTALRADDTNVIALVKHMGDPSWMILNAGSNSLKLECDESSSGSVEIEYYAPYF